MTAYTIRPHIKLWKKRNRNQQKHTELWSGGILCLLQTHKKPRLVNWCLGVSTQVALHLSLSMCYSAAQKPASGRRKRRKSISPWNMMNFRASHWIKVNWIFHSMNMSCDQKRETGTKLLCLLNFWKGFSNGFTPVQTNPIDVVSVAVLLLLPVFWPKQ